MCGEVAVKGEKYLPLSGHLYPSTIQEFNKTPSAFWPLKSAPPLKSWGPQNVGKTNDDEVLYKKRP